MLEKARFAAGCFWGVQANFDALDAVVKSEVGYSGGNTKNPTYKEVCKDYTEHAESIDLSFDNELMSYEDLLRHFFKIHDPTTLNRQGLDIGSQYRSIIFYYTDYQKETALRVIAELNKSKIYPSHIVTEIKEAHEFYPAEEYHQNYLKKKHKQII